MKPHVKKLLRIGLLLMFLFSTAMSVRTLSISRKGAQVYEDAHALAVSPTRAPESQGERSEATRVRTIRDWWRPMVL